MDASETCTPGETRCPEAEDAETCGDDGHWMPTPCGPGEVCNPVSHAQQNFVVEVPLVGGGSQFVWTGDAWQTAPDGRLGHDPQVWIPLDFDANGVILPLARVDNFTLDVDAA